VSVVGLGLAALGRPGYINLGHGDDVADASLGGMERAAHAVLDAAYDRGVRHFDAARSYGRAEAFLSSWLRARGLRRDEVVVSSKWGYEYTAGWRVDAEHHEIKELSAERLRTQWGESQALLGEWLALYQIHSATLDSGVLDDPDTLRALAAARDEGLAIGLTLSGPRQAETLHKALAIRIDGAPLFGAVQATWNLLERSAGDALHAAHDAGVGVIIKEGLANGRLTDRNPELSPAIRGAAMRAGTTIDALVLAAVLAQPWVDVVLSGAATVEQLKSNAAALSIAWDPSFDRDLQSIVEPPDRYWSTRAMLNWN